MLYANTSPKFGVYLSTRLAVTAGANLEVLLKTAEMAEAAGFDSIWVGDSLLARPRPEPLTLLAAIAARTQRVMLGTAVLLPALRHPLTTAHTVATVDQLAQGRLILGVGAGFNYPATVRELNAVGVDFKERVGRTLEAITVMRRLWTGAPVSFQGKYFRLDEVTLEPQPVQRGGPPLWMGGNTPAACARAGRVADGWLPTSATPGAFANGFCLVQDAGKAIGRNAVPLATATLATVNINPDTETAERDLRRYLIDYYGMPLETLKALLGCRSGTPEKVAEWLAGFIQAGVRHVILRFGGDDQLAQLERAATAVVPRLRATVTS
jgi:probable F420-dependent oxidoreductase